MEIRRSAMAFCTGILCGIVAGREGESGFCKAGFGFCKSGYSRKVESISGYYRKKTEKILVLSAKRRLFDQLRQEKWVEKACQEGRWHNALVNITKQLAGILKIRCEMYKLVKSFDFGGNTPLTNVHHGSIILVLFLTKQ